MVENISNNRDPDYDVIVIGAGMGGLVAANLLTKEGYKVLIVEKNLFPGGFCTNFKRKDYIFDVALHWTGGCEINGTIDLILKKFNAENCVDFIKLNELYRWIDYENNIEFHSPISFQKFIDSLISTFPNEKEKIKKFFDLYGNIVDNKIIGTLLNKKVSDIIDPFNFNSALKNLITAELGLFKWPPDDLSALFFILCVVSHYLMGAYYIKGGSGAFSKAIAEIFVKNGGTLKLSTEAIKITFKDNIAMGIIAKDKDEKNINISARSLIANCDATMLVSKLCSDNHLPSKYIESIKKRIPSYSAVNLYLGLNCDLKQHNINDYGIWVSKFRNNSLENLTKSLETADYSNFPIGSILIYSNIDPTCCPPDKSVISIYSIAIPEPFENALDAQGKEGNNYQALKRKIADQLINRVSNILKFPDLRSYIEVMELATPITFRRYSYNRGGALMGWEMNPEQWILNQLPQKTPIKNLFLCGQWTNQGGGIANVMKSGDLAAQLVKKYLE